jgi:hypothetical protein
VIVLLPGDESGPAGARPADGADRLDELIGLDVLEQEPAGPRPQRLVDVLVEVEGG